MQDLENILMEYFNDHLSQDDRVKVEEWVKASSENKVIFDQAGRLFELSELQSENFNPDVELAWQKVQDKIEQSPKGKQVFIQLKYIYRVAAVLVFAMSIGLLSYVVTNNDLKVVASQSGERQELKLPDGTTIFLNENSRIKYDEDFDDDKRIVYLDGQAFFNVARDEERPFEIIGKSATISVLGTSFDFLSRSGFAHVNVSTGKVSFKSNEVAATELILVKNQQGKLVDRQLTKLESLDEKAISWRFEELIFKSAPLTEVADKLSKFYKVSFELDASIENCLITTSFTNQTLDEVLNILNVIANIKNERSGDIVKLSGPGC